MGMGNRVAATLCVALATACVVPAVAGAQARSDVWDAVSGSLPRTKGGSRADIQPSAYKAFKLDRSGLTAGLKGGAESGAAVRRAKRVGDAHAALAKRRLRALRGL